MHYPNWYLPEMGGGLLIAIIAVLHVLIAHLAVGGGLFLVLTERKARKNKDEGLLAYVRSHTWFFVLLTMVFGGVSGVGIWFVIALVQPDATSLLIHEFVFGWAIEWVFFIGEIVALLIYHYRFDKMNARDHMIVGWLYFAFAWLSLFIINGILGFMLTPGKWVETGGFWQGFFNPSFFPSLIFRTCISFIFAGVFGMVTASFRKDAELRNRVMKYCGQWLYFPLVVLALTGIYYASVIGDQAFQNVFHMNPESTVFQNLLLISSLLLFGVGLISLFRLQQWIQKAGAFLLVFIALGWMGGFEYLREIARKPYVIYHTMYSNSLRPADIDRIRREGFLPNMEWAKVSVLTEDNTLQAGAEIFRLQCMICHTYENYNGIKNKMERMTERGIEAQLTGMGKVNAYMPPFAGTAGEKKALAAWLFQEIVQGDPFVQEDYTPPQYAFDIPDFDQRNDEYVLLVWNDLGMHCISDDEQHWAFLPPANSLNAQLVRRGAKPEIVTRGVKLVYEVEEQHANPQDHSMFWKYDKEIFGVDLPEGEGLAGFALNDTMHAQADRFVAELIPVMPYRDDGQYNPYPIFTVKAIDETSGELLAMTRTVAPTSTEMGCRNCHGGDWAWNGISGVSAETSQNILAAHDRYSGTTLLEDALNGQPRLCQSCHADPAVGAPGLPGIMNFSASIHGFHANYLSGMDQEACNLCHPSRTAGNTTCFRGRHAEVGINCTNCHGRLEDHALSLLKGEADKPSSGRLAANLVPVFVADQASVNPRTPWLMEPDCKGCHNNFNIKEDGWRGTSFNQWAPGFTALYRNRTDNMGMMCISCHGSTHAIYGAMNKYGKQRDNIQPLQYQGMAGTIGTHNACWVCHIKDMPVSGHHRNQVNRKVPAVLVE